MSAPEVLCVVFTVLLGEFRSSRTVCLLQDSDCLFVGAIMSMERPGLKSFGKPHVQRAGTKEV